MIPEFPEGMATHAAIPSNAVGLFIRWVVLGAALVAELFGLTLRFESPLIIRPNRLTRLTWMGLIQIKALALACSLNSEANWSYPNDSAA